MLLANFYIFYENSIKTFILWFINNCFVILTIIMGKLCDIMPLSPFPVCVCVVCLCSFSKKKKKKIKKIINS